MGHANIIYLHRCFGRWFESTRLDGCKNSSGRSKFANHLLTRVARYLVSTVFFDDSRNRKRSERRLGEKKLATKNVKSKRRMEKGAKPDTQLQIVR